MKADGYAGQMLWVDLGKGEIKSEPTNKEYLQRFVGGRGLGIKLLSELAPPKVDPLDPQNPLILATGPYTGSGVFSAFFNVTTKAPLTEIAASSHCGGKWGPRLKRAGFASSLLEDGDTLLTHCNVSGEMVLIGRACKEAGKSVQFFATETRPYFQGRLTAWELAEDGFEVTIVPDNAIGSLLSEGRCNKALVGSDRVAGNGDVVNKVGTFQVAVAAKKFQVPFYVLVQEPGSTSTGEEIPIEERDMREVLMYKGKRLYPETVKGYYPAFDLTPARYITHLITFGGIIDPRELPRAWKTVQGAMKS